VLLGGDAAPPPLIAEAAARDVPVVLTYGMTETCSQIATARPGDRPRGGGAVGPPLAGVEVRIVRGEIHVRGASIFSGYLPGEGVALPFLKGGWFPTGDRGFLDDAGTLHVTGRTRDVIVTGGENVDPREIELALLAHPAIVDVCVFGVADERWGEIVAAAIVLDVAEAPLPLAAIARYAAGRLAPHKRPRRVALVGALTLNGSGKVDRRAVALATAARLVRLEDLP
jgi:O-succinylbenzoic acid--CoA ligase